jgi:hypothetical protein
MDHDQYDYSFQDYSPTIAFDSFLNEEITGEAFGRFQSQKAVASALSPQAKPNSTGKRKNREKGASAQSDSLPGANLSASSTGQEDKESSEKKPVGRPKKPPVDPSLPKRPVGRPRIYPAPPADPNKPKRGRFHANDMKKSFGVCNLGFHVFDIFQFRKEINHWADRGRSLSTSFVR